MMEERRQKTINTFNKHAVAYQQKYMHQDQYYDTFDAFCDLIPAPKSSIFEIACGPGNITKYMLSKRPDFIWEAIDLAPNMVELARSNNPTATIHLMDCRDINRLDKKYDGIIAGFCLPYLSKEEVKKLLRDCTTLLNANGILYLSTMEGNYEDSGYQTSSDGKDLAYTYYHSTNFLKELLVNAGFQIAQSYKRDFTKPGETIPSAVDTILIAKKV